MLAIGAAKKTTYKAISRSVLNNGAPIWGSKISNTTSKHQNIALSPITGCVKISDINYLLNEDEILPVK